MTGSRQPLVSRMLQQCNDIELNPGPKNGSPMKKSISSVKLNGLNSNKSDNNGDARDNLPAHDPPRIKKLGKNYGLSQPACEPPNHTLDLFTRLR